MIKSNYDTHFKECLENAERSLNTITQIKKSLEQPINEMLQKLSQQEFGFAAEFQKQQLEIDEQRQLIEKLTSQISSLKSHQKDPKEKLKIEKSIIKELKIVQKENKQMKETIQEYKDEVDYCKQRENKLMYFLYIMKEKGLPVGEIFESEIKDIPTKRFSKFFDDEENDERPK
jgi:chromosome segregation ATPase